MSVTSKQHVGLNSISGHCWNKDKSEIALFSTNNEVILGRRKNDSIDINTKNKLEKHNGRVLGIDWGSKFNRIITCGADRNAYVWSFIDGRWEPELVVLRIDRAATCVKWSNSEKKFAVGSGSRLISICFFDERQNFWKSLHIKKSIRSTISCLDWHPSDLLLACGTMNYRSIIFTSSISSIDDINQQDQCTNWLQNKKIQNDSFQGVCEWKSASGGWIHDIKYSRNGDLIAWCSHDSIVSLVDSANPKTVLTYFSPNLPNLSILWISPNEFLTAGYDCIPYRMKYEVNEIICQGRIDEESNTNSTNESTKNEGGSISRKMAFNIFQARTERGENLSTIGKKNNVIHKMPILCMKSFVELNNRVKRFTSVSIDGQLTFWTL
ncbi:hypothetical protein SNEBB_006708 [Seison nebaliae]|nr:hypothetical protein SNEBB_006708 [Seison nebaliae]